MMLQTKIQNESAMKYVAVLLRTPLSDEEPTLDFDDEVEQHRYCDKMIPQVTLAIVVVGGVVVVALTKRSHHKMAKKEK